jgi:hypothetical protein
MWIWEHSRFYYGSSSIRFIPHLYARSSQTGHRDGGNKVNLKKLNQAFFNRLKSRVVEAKKRRIYVCVMFFQGFSTDQKPRRTQGPWIGHPFYKSNSIQEVNGDFNGDNWGEEVHRIPSDFKDRKLKSRIEQINNFQKVYIRKVLDTLRNQENVIYEIGNEMDKGSINFQNHMVNFIKDYLKVNKYPQVPVGITGSPIDNKTLFKSSADWISPMDFKVYGNKNNKGKFPIASGNKIVLNDSDHTGPLNTYNDERWVWMAFTRGHHPILMDNIWGNDSFLVRARKAMGDTLRYVNRVNFVNMVPSTSKSSTKFALVHEGNTYIVYQPGSGKFDVNMKAGIYDFEWFNPKSSKVASFSKITLNDGIYSFTPPFNGNAVLFLKKEE